MNIMLLVIGIAAIAAIFALLIGGVAIGVTSERRRIAGEGFERAMWDW